MTLDTRPRGLVHLYHLLRRRHAPAVDDLGFGYSRDLDQPTSGAVPDGVELHFFTGRTRQEATR
jgi:hypothetical protein